MKIVKLLSKVALGCVALIVVIAIIGFFALKRDDIPYATLTAKYGNPASKFIDLPSGVHMHYRDQGNAQGRVLLLVHGFSVNLETWENWIPLLGTEYRLVSLDLPAHGLTEAPDSYPANITGLVDTVDEFATTLGLTKFTLAGNSMGGNIAWLYATKHPEKLDALILVDAGGWPPKGMEDGAAEVPLVFRIVGNPHIAPLIAQLDPAPLLRNGLKLAYANDALATDEMVTRYAECARAPRHREMLGAIERSFGGEVFASEEKLAAIHTPTLILWGVKDELIPVDDAMKFNDAIKGSTMLLYPEVGHEPHEEFPQQSAADVKAFLAQHPPANVAKS
jgi:pimeloyl-ACP methyl ester carboxylesterase